MLNFVFRRTIMKTRIFVVSLVLVAIVVLGAIGGSRPVSAQGGTAAPTMAMPDIKTKVKVAVIATSAKNDLAWTQSMVDALLAVQKALGGADKMDVSVSENLFQVPDAAAAARDYASQGYDLVIMHGTQYGESMFEVAKDFPDVSFAWGTASDTGDSKGLKNVFAYEARAEEGGYVNGVMAAMLTKSGIIGIVGPIEAGDAKLHIDGFEQGAKATKPDVKVLKTYIGSFSDTAKATEAAKAQIAQGADVLTGSAQIVPGPITEIQKAKGYWFGTQSNQADGWKDTVVAAQVFFW